MNFKKLLLVSFLIIFNSCALSLKVGEKTYPTQNSKSSNIEVIQNEQQLQNKLRTDFNFRYDFAQYALRQPSSFDWNNPLLNNRYNFYNPYLGYNYFWDRNQMWNDWLWGFTPHRWSIFGYDRWGYNNYYSWNTYGRNNYYGWDYRYNFYNGYRGTNVNYRTNRRNTQPVRRINSTRIIRRNTNITRIPPTTRPRTIRSSEERIVKPRRTQTTILPVRNNQPIIRNNPPNRNIRVNPPSRPPMNSRPQTQPIKRNKRNN